MSEDLRYPIGEFNANFEVSDELRNSFIQTLKDLPKNLTEAVEGLNDEQLDTEYRPEGWTIRQVVHHVADSHLNAYCRFRLALTEDKPTIRPYMEDRWAKLSDYQMPVEVSLNILEGVHQRMVEMLSSISQEDFRRKLIHPDSGEWTLEKMIGLYDWHSRHHTAHITNLRKRMNW